MPASPPHERFPHKTIAMDPIRRAQAGLDRGCAADPSGHRCCNSPHRLSTNRSFALRLTLRAPPHRSEPRLHRLRGRRRPVHFGDRPARPHFRCPERLPEVCSFWRLLSRLLDAPRSRPGRRSRSFEQHSAFRHARSSTRRLTAVPQEAAAGVLVALRHALPGSRGACRAHRVDIPVPNGRVLPLAEDAGRAHGEGGGCGGGEIRRQGARRGILLSFEYDALASPVLAQLQPRAM